MINRKKPYYLPGPLKSPHRHLAAQEVTGARLIPVAAPSTLEVSAFELPRNNADISRTTRKQGKETYHFPPTFVLEIPRGRVLERDGLVITPHNAVLRDTAIHFGQPPDRHRIFAHKSLSSPTPITGRVAVLASMDAKVYFHWMCNILPRLGILQESGVAIDAFYLPELTHPYQMQTLEHLGVLKHQKVLGGHIQAETLVVPSLPAAPCDCPPAVCDFLRRHFLPKQLPAQTRHLYISRAGARRRQVVNEDKVMATLVALGFTCIRPEAHTVLEQASLFASAKTIIAPHGAALTNLVFCQPGTQVFEIFHPAWICDCYWQVSHYLGLDHHVMTASKGYRNFINRINDRNRDIQIDIDQLLMKLRKKTHRRARS